MSFSMWAFQTAGWWWNLHGLNNLADILDHAGIIRALNDGVYDEEEYRLRFVHNLTEDKICPF
jgi:predicted chitinase